MDISSIIDFATTSKQAVDLFKSAYELVPKGEKRDEIQRKVQMAENILLRSDAKLAKDLGYEFCRCSFPPNIMLWNEAEKSHICPNQSCGGRRFKFWSTDDQPIHNSGSWMSS